MHGLSPEGSQSPGSSSGSEKKCLGGGALSGFFYNPDEAQKTKQIKRAVQKFFIFGAVMFVAVCAYDYTYEALLQAEAVSPYYIAFFVALVAGFIAKSIFSGKMKKLGLEWWNKPRFYAVSMLFFVVPTALFFAAFFHFINIALDHSEATPRRTQIEDRVEAGGFGLKPSHYLLLKPWRGGSLVCIRATLKEFNEFKDNAEVLISTKPGFLFNEFIVKDKNHLKRLSRGDKQLRLSEREKKAEGAPAPAQNGQTSKKQK